MIQTVTNDLIRLAYKETNHSLETIKIVEAVENNPQLKENFEQLMTIKSDLDLVAYEPSDASIDYILNYSQNIDLVIS